MTSAVVGIVPLFAKLICSSPLPVSAMLAMTLPPALTVPPPSGRPQTVSAPPVAMLKRSSPFAPVHLRAMVRAGAGIITRAALSASSSISAMLNARPAICTAVPPSMKVALLVRSVKDRGVVHGGDVEGDGALKRGRYRQASRMRVVMVTS